MRRTYTDEGTQSIVRLAVSPTQSLECESRLAVLLHPWYSKTGSMAQSGISGSRLHLLHLSATAPSAPLARSFHLDCGKTGAPREPPLKQKQQSKARSIRYFIRSSKCFTTKSYYYVISIFSFSASPFRYFVL